MKFRLRFSVRTLAIFVTLVCFYFGAWEATKRYGVAPTSDDNDPAAPAIESGGAPLPFFVWQNELDRDYVVMPGSHWKRVRRYYLWLFGLKIKLPVESKWQG